MLDASWSPNDSAVLEMSKVAVSSGSSRDQRLGSLDNGLNIGASSGVPLVEHLEMWRFFGLLVWILIEPRPIVCIGVAAAIFL